MERSEVVFVLCFALLFVLFFLKTKGVRLRLVGGRPVHAYPTPTQETPDSETTDTNTNPKIKTKTSSPVTVSYQL